MPRPPRAGRVLRTWSKSFHATRTDRAPACYSADLLLLRLAASTSEPVKRAGLWGEEQALSRWRSAVALWQAFPPQDYLKLLDGEARGARCATVLARNADKAVLLLHDGATFVFAESTAPRWRGLPALPLSTPLLLLGGADGLPAAASQHPLDPSPPEVVQLAERLRVDIAHLVTAVRMS